MNKEELYDLIERYLDNALPDAERREVERRMAGDAAFRAEVELHRAMQEHLGDPDELHLRALLDDVRNDGVSRSAGPAQKSGAPFTVWRRYWAAAATVLVLLVALFWWLRPSPPLVEQPMAQNPQLPAPPPAEAPRQEEPLWVGAEEGVDTFPEKAPRQGEPQRTLPPSDKENLIAMADPADFVVNADLEETMGAQLRGPDAAVALLSPDSGAVLKLRSDHTVVIPVDVRVDIALVSEGQPFRMFIYSNKPQDWEKKKPVFARDVPLVAVGDTAYEARFRQKLSLKPGLYYLIIRQKRTIELEDPYRTRWVGKFSVLK